MHMQEVKKNVMKRVFIFVLCISLLLISTGCDDTKETKILNFEESDIETVEIYRFNIPAEVQGMIVTENEYIEKIINAFSEIKIKGDATDFDVVGGETTSFRFNLKNSEEFIVAHSEGSLRNLDNINYKASADSIVKLWNDLDYQKATVSNDELPIISN